MSVARSRRRLEVARPAAAAGARAASRAEDPFSRVGGDASEVERLAAILDVRARQPGQRAIWSEGFGAAGIVPGMRVAEIGCGTGAVTRQLAEVVGPTGTVVGYDISEPLLDHARRQPSPGAPISYRVGDAYQLATPVARFDATVSYTLLSHLERPAEVLRQMRSITRRGGVVLVLDQDYQTLVFNHAAPALGSRILAHAWERHILNPWCGRELHGLLAGARLDGIQGGGSVYIERDASSYLITIAERIAKLAADDGAVTREDAVTWTDGLHAQAAAGTFFASLNYYFAWGRVP